MDINGILALVTLVVLLIGLIGGIMALGRKDQQVLDLVEDVKSIKQNTDEFKTGMARVEERHTALEKRVTAIEEARAGCRLPHDH